MANPILYLDAQWKKGLRDELNAKLQKFKFDKLNVEIGFDEKKFVANMNKMIKQVQQLMNNMNKLNAQVNPAEAIVSGYRDASAELDKLAKKIMVVQVQASAIKDDKRSEALVKLLTELRQRYEDLKKSASSYENPFATKEEVETWKNKAKEVDNTASAITKLVKETEKQIKADEKLAAANAKAEAAEKKQEEQQEDTIKLIQLKRQEWDRWVKSLTKQEGVALEDEIKAVNVELDKLEENGSSSFTVLNALMRDAKGAQKDLHKGLVQTTDALDRSSVVVGELYKKVAMLFSFATLLRGAQTLFRNAYNEVKAIDDAMVDLRKVTDETEAAYSKFLDSATEKSIRLGSTVSDVVQITANWAKLGYSLNEASELSESSIIYMNVSDVANVDEAVQHLTTTIKAFNWDVNDSIGIVDRYNAISNEFAVTAEGLGQAMKTAGSSLSLAGNSLDQSLGMVTGITEITGNANEAGNALRTISMRLRGAKAELDEIGEDTEGMITITAKLRDKIKQLAGVDITDANGQLRSTYEVLGEIAEQWDKFDTNTQAVLLEDLAGKTRANQLGALLQNWKQVVEATDTATNSTNSALIEQEKYANSIEFKATQLKATIQDLYSNILNSDTVKNILDLARDILNVVNTIVKQIGTLPFIIGSIGGIVGKNIIGNGNVGSTLSNTFKSLFQGGRKNLRGSSFGGSILSRQDIQLVEEYNHQIELGVKDSKELQGIIDKISNSSLKAEMSSLDGAKYSTEAYTKAVQAATLKTTLLSAAVSFGISAIISLASTFIKNFIANLPTLSNLSDKIQDVNKRVSETQSEIDGVNDRLDEVNARIKEINDVGGLDVVNDKEYQQLILERQELEAQLELLIAKKALQKTEQQKTAGQWWDTYTSNTGYSNDMSDFAPRFDPFTGLPMPEQANATYNYSDGGNLGGSNTNIQQAINNYQTLVEKAKELKKEQGEGSQAFKDAMQEVNDAAQKVVNIQDEILKNQYDENGTFIGDPEDYKEVSGYVNQLNEIIKGFNEDFVLNNDDIDEAIDSFEELDKKSKKSLKDVLKNLRQTNDGAKTLRKTVKSLSRENLDEAFESENIESLIEEFPELKSHLNDYANGLIDADELQEKFRATLEDWDAGLLEEKFKALKDAVKEYGEESEEARLAMVDFIDASPDLQQALELTGIKLDVATLAAYDNADALYTDMIRLIDLQIQEAKFKLTQLEDSYTSAARVMDGARPSLLNGAIAAIAAGAAGSIDDINELSSYIKSLESTKTYLSNLKVSSGSTYKNRSGGKSGSSGSGSGKSGKSGSGSKSSSSNTNTSIISETYQNEVDLNEWYIKQSENRQKRMNKETDEYRQETAKQYAYYKNLAEKTYDEIQRLQKKGYDENNEEYRDLVDQYNNYLNNIYSTSEDIWDSLNDAQQKELESEIKALEDKQDKLDEQIKAYEDEKDAIDKVIEGYEKEQKAIDKQIDAHDEEIEAIQKKQDLIDKEIEKVEEQKEDEEERWEAREKSLDFEIERNNAILELEKQRYDTIKSVKQEQMNLDTQLKASKESYKYLDEETRQLLFNEDDYNDLSNQLTQIAEEATQMYDDYLERLNNVTEETGYELEYITDEFERQYELKMKEYEIAKQELSVAKARKELENVSAERNVAMLVNGQWTWVADPNKVKSAVEAVGKAEMSVTQSQDELEQTRILQALQEANSELTLTKNQEEAESNKILETLDAQIAEFERQIALLDDEIAVIEGIIEGLGKQKEELDAQIEGLEEQQDLIDDQIEGIEKQKDIIEEQIKDIELQVGALKDLVFDFASFSTALENGSDAISQAIDVINGRALSPEILGSFADGGTANFDGLALLHGANGAETILNNTDAAKLYNFIHNSPNLYSDILDRIHIPMANGGVYPTTYGASTNVYVDGVQLSQADSESIVEIFKRVIPIAR